jgi:germination protein M
MQKIFSLILVCVVTMAVFSGCGSTDDSFVVDELTPASSVSLGENQAGELTDRTPYKLYFVNDQGKLSSETRYIDNTEASKGNESLATVLVKELINGPAKGSLLEATIPQGTKVNSDVTIKDNIATVDLSKEFVDKHQGGKKNEQLTLYSIVNTLTELKDIKSVQFKIDGKVKKDFKGSYQLDMAFPRSAYLNSTQSNEKDVIKLDENSAAKDSTNKDNTNLDNTNKGNTNKDNLNKGNINKDNTNKDNTNMGNTNKDTTNKENQQQAPSNQSKESPAEDHKTNADIETEILE